MLSVGDDHAPRSGTATQRLTYADLRARAHAVAARLLHQGLAKGDRVGLLAENGPFFVESYLGVILAGLCVVPFQTDCSDQTLRQIVASTGMKRMLVSAKFGRRVEPLAESLGMPLDVESPPRADGVRPPAPAQIDPSRDLAAIMFTSGSTGEPKGVMVTHRNIECNTRDIVRYSDSAADDRVMVVLPFYYCYGASLLHTHLMAGGSLVLNNRFLFPEKVLDEMVQTAVHRPGGRSLDLPDTVAQDAASPSASFPALRWLQQAGGRLPDPLLARNSPGAARGEIVRHVRPDRGHRPAELPAARAARRQAGLDRPRTGRARGWKCSARRHARSPGSDEVGEIVASGDNITLGYWGDPEETARYFRDGKLYTGDMARVDADGFIFIVERARDFIKSMGNRVSPKEVEEVIAEMPEVVEAAVVGVPDEICGRGDQGVRRLTAAGPADGRATSAGHCLKRLPNYKVPAVRRVSADRLPKTAHGKVDQRSQLARRRNPEAPMPLEPAVDRATTAGRRT